MCGERRSVNVLTLLHVMSLLCQYGNSTLACRFDTITNQNEIAERRRNGLNVFGLCTRIVFGFWFDL